MTYQVLKAYVKFQVLSHFERCPGFDKKRCVKKIPGGVNGEMEDFRWSCRSYQANFPSLENITGVLIKIEIKQDNRMDKLEDRIMKVEQVTGEEIRKSVDSMKKEILDTIKEDIETVVDTRTAELEDRKRRDQNLTVFNLPEHISSNNTENKHQDEEDLRLISSLLGLESILLTTQYRLGKKDDSKTRPIKMVLESKAQRKFLLDNARFIQSKAPPQLKRVIITMDLTPKQREERTAKFRNKKRNAPTVNPEHRREPGPNGNLENMSPRPMETEYPLPSPIQGRENVQMSELSQPSRLSDHKHSTAIVHGLYEQSTLPDGRDEAIVIYNEQSANQEPLSPTMSHS